MAKKKKQTRKRKNKPEVVERSGFWPMAGAILLVVTAFFLLLGGFGTGGPLPIGMFRGAYATLGWIAYLAPVALAFFGVWKFTSEDKQIPLSKFVSMLAFITFSAAWAHVAFVNKDVGGDFIGGHGGMVGGLVGGLMLNALDKIPASILFFVLALLMFLLTFGISPKVFLELLEVFRRLNMVR